MMSNELGRVAEGKRILVTGGTGSLGKVLTRALLSGRYGRPAAVIIFSRDEGKHHDMRLDFRHMAAASEDVTYEDAQSTLQFRVGDVRDYASVAAALRNVDLVFNAAALKQVPSCEYFVSEAVQTNVLGPRNIVRAIVENDLPVQTVIGVSTDKACHPVNVMGMTKALQERLFISANIESHGTRFICARYGNVLASRGSVIPLFHAQIAAGGPITLTDRAMTRFFLPLSYAVTTIMTAAAEGEAGETYVPRVPGAEIEMLARQLIGERPVSVELTGIRPGEKIHETLIAEDEAHRTIARGDFFVIRPALPELAAPVETPAFGGAFTSRDYLMGEDELATLLATERLRIDDAPNFRALY